MIIEEIDPHTDVIEEITKGLFKEYEEKYGDYFKDSINEEDKNEFLPPKGCYLVMKFSNEIVAMGAFKAFDDSTAELKRIWTHRNYRQLGLAVKLVNILEEKAFELGYEKIFLTTGFRQPEAVNLYLKLGYHALFDVNQPFETYAEPPFDGRLRFIKARNKAHSLLG
ncbi:GNAT family N-acetyltransferase [Thorsellia kenyensis]|uniref:GNAT family N-acetyltransferase n=1 Tax=Thorsellia kenyensis TaxID=1549888 RepID=A0ABV6CB88_9GAMM